MKRIKIWIVTLLLLISISACGQPAASIPAESNSSAAFPTEPTSPATEQTAQITPESALPQSQQGSFSVADIDAYTGQPYIVVNDNIPYFSEEDLTLQPFELYSDLDDLGRCGAAFANICLEIMPTEERGAIGQIKPTGWHTIKYDIVEGNYLYNRCHLIGYQLSGENANEKNLITGTRYMNVEGMEPFENMVAAYVKKTENHVVYRVTPIFDGNNLLASGVLMEAESVEDKGDGIRFCVYVYNVQPGITIDYASGESSIDENTPETQSQPEAQGTAYILNTNTKKFHYPSCSGVNDMKDKNKKEYIGNREDIIAQGYEPCQRCKP